MPSATRILTMSGEATRSDPSVEPNDALAIGSPKSIWAVHASSDTRIARGWLPSRLTVTVALGPNNVR